MSVCVRSRYAQTLLLPVMAWCTLSFSSMLSADTSAAIASVADCAGWRSGASGGAPFALKGARGGVGFESAKTLTAKRSYWDKSVRLDLSTSEIFEMEILLVGLENISEVSLHFRSGAGWYSSARAVDGSSATVLQFDRDKFIREGEPDGWDQVELIRISIWHSGLGSAGMHLYRFMAASPQVLLVKDGTRSTPDPLSERAAGYLEQWLFDIGVSARSVFATELTSRLLAERKLLVLPYNPTLTDQQIGLLKDFIADGGRLFVFYGDKPALAKSMGFRLGNYMRPKENLPWEQMLFSSAADRAFPAVIYQRATAVISVYPDHPDARILANWKTRKAGAGSPPALLEGPGGFWMTQIPRAFHAVAKRQILAAAVARMVPSLAPSIGRRMLVYAGQVDSFHSVPDASLSLRRLAVDNGSDNRTIADINYIDATYRAAQAALLRGEVEPALAHAIDIRARLEQAYASIHAPEPKEGLRGVWDHHGIGLYPGDWERTCAVLKSAGLNAVFPNMLNDGQAHYASGLLTHSPTMQALGDQIEQCLAAANAHDMEVHVWKVCWKIDGAPAEFIERMKREGRLQIDSNGKVLPWLNPAHPENRAWAIANLKEVVGKYPVAGVHLDYIRYRSSNVCFSAFSRRAFEGWLGATVADWPEAALPGGRLGTKFNEWKVEQITSFVGEAYRAVKKLRPEIKFSAAVWGGYPSCVQTVAQDWVSWLEKGIVDFLVPMDYTESIDFFESLLDQHRKIPNAQGKIYPGIGVTSSQSSLAPSNVIEQINLIHAQGFPGYLLFDLDMELEQVVLPRLRRDKSQAASGVLKP